MENENVLDIPVKPKTISGLHRRQQYTVEYDPVMKKWHWRIVVTRMYKTSGQCDNIAAAEDAAIGRINLFLEGDEQ